MTRNFRRLHSGFRALERRDQALHGDPLAGLRSRPASFREPRVGSRSSLQRRELRRSPPCYSADSLIPLEDELELHPKLRDELQAGYQKLLNTGELKSKDALAGYYSLFRQRFGPEVLRNTDGEELLALIKGFGRDALIYWLEFKDDDEFPASFGSIAGGSALKYAVYKRNDTSAWMTGSPSQQRDVPVSEAVRIAQSHRDQLLAACRLLEALPIGADDDRYASLQTQLREVAPDVEDTAWGHKYLSR